MWLKGQTTWVNLTSDLTKLLCGEITDGGGNTVPLGDRWIRETAGQDCIYPPSTQDVAGIGGSLRTGYFSAFTGRLASTNVENSPKTVCKQTNIFTSAPGGATKWALVIAVTTANTVIGDYSTARVGYAIFNMDTAVFISANNSLAPAANGNLTITNGCTINISNPTGFILINEVFHREFTSVYVGGIDWFGPFYHLRNSAVSFSVAPPGSTGTDWDVVEIPHIASMGTGGTSWGSGGSSYTGVNLTQQSGGMGGGLGIKTNTILTGALYTCSWTCAGTKMRLANSASNGQIDLFAWAGFANDGGTYRRMGGTQRTAWLRPYQTPAQVTNGSAVQYWMSVKANKVCIILNADPAQTGKLCCNWFGKLQNLQEPTYDKFPWVCGQANTLNDYTADNTNDNGFDLIAPGYLAHFRSRQDGSEGRDWQTAWIKADGGSMLSNDLFNFVSSMVNPAVTLQAVGMPSTSRTLGVNPTQGLSRHAAPITQQKPNPWDNKWWLYAFYYADWGFTSNDMSNDAIGDAIRSNSDSRFIRADSTPFFYWLSQTGWSSGDELTDTATSKVYFLVGADYHSIGARMRIGTNIFYGGAAVLEE